MDHSSAPTSERARLTGSQLAAGVSRRVFLRRASLGSLVLGAGAATLLEACAGGTTSQSAPSAAPRASSAAAQVSLPTYVPFQGPKPDLPSPNPSIDPGYFTFPKQLAKSVPQPPGHGDEVTALTRTPSPTATPMEQNAAWQELNKQMNLTFRLSMISAADYAAKLSTIVAGGELPDLLYTDQVASPILRFPTFLQAQCADLTPYLSGDAVKAYPNLANLTTLSWKSTVFNNAIYGVPVPQFQYGATMLAHQELLDQAGVQHPKTADELKRMLLALTNPQGNVWGTAANVGTAFDLQSGGYYPAMFGAPNNWLLDKSGSLVKDYETDEYKAAVGYVRDLYAAGVFHPNSLTYTVNSVNPDFIAGRFVMHVGTWSSFSVGWDRAAAFSPNIHLRLFDPFGYDGGKASQFLSRGISGVTVIKQGPADRVKELLSVLNFLAAPFGSQEALLLQYGTEGTDFNYDGNGTPALTTRGVNDLYVAWRYVASGPPVLYDANRSQEYASVQQEAQMKLPSVSVADPTLGLHSGTWESTGTTFTNTFEDDKTDNKADRRPNADHKAKNKDWRSHGGDQVRGESQQALSA